MSIPNGVLMPVLALGACVGRIFGELMLARFPDGVGDGGVIYPGGYALAGAAAFTGGVTHALSGAIILFEFTGQIVYLIPVLVSALCSTGISRLITASVYDTGVRDKGLPYLPPLREWTSKITARDVMTTDLHPISSISSIGQLCAALIHNTGEIVPVVSKSESVLRGCVKRVEVEDAVIEYLEKVDPEFIEEAIPTELFFALSKSKLQEMLLSDSPAKRHLPLFSDEAPEDEQHSEPLENARFNRSKSMVAEELAPRQEPPPQPQPQAPLEPVRAPLRFSFGTQSQTGDIEVIEHQPLYQPAQQSMYQSMHHSQHTPSPPPQPQLTPQPQSPPPPRFSFGPSHLGQELEILEFVPNRQPIQQPLHQPLQQPVQQPAPQPAYQPSRQSDHSTLRQSQHHPDGHNRDVIEFVHLPKTTKQVDASEPASISAGTKEGISVSSTSVLELKTTGNVLRLYSTPIQLSESSSLATMHQLFVMNRLSCAFVTNTGVLVGLVKRSDLAKYDGTVNVMKPFQMLTKSHF
eukprot:TRINITY_DN1820_c0_g6_i1.p1 TRINITY_DN1820_c0_g6~~TRINITY_DN1820_c0_g6_i1.p1  ORF type:complete len:546 (+),score=124.73 TRINITY_DN1820_c0_g6_i1:77-1639(+)